MLQIREENSVQDHSWAFHRDKKNSANITSTMGEMPWLCKLRVFKSNRNCIKYSLICYVVDEARQSSSSGNRVHQKKKNKETIETSDWIPESHSCETHRALRRTFCVLSLGWLSYMREWGTNFINSTKCLAAWCVFSPCSSHTRPSL